MSGVLYGLFGYLWLRGLSDPAYPLRMTDGRRWFFPGLVRGVVSPACLGPIANGAHTTGLAARCGVGSGAGRLGLRARER